MKKLFLAVALVMGLGTSVAFANNMVSDVEIATMINEFKPIDVKELPQAVQDAIKENYSEATIKEAAVEVAEELRLTRLHWWMQPVQRIRSFSMKKGKFRNKLYTQ